MISSDHSNYVKRSNTINSPEYTIPSTVADLMEKELNCVTGGRAQHGLRWEHKGVGVVFLQEITSNDVTIYILPTKIAHWRTQKALEKIFLENNLSHLNTRIIEKGEGKHIRVANVSWDDSIKVLPILVNWSYSSQTGKSLISDLQAIKPEWASKETDEYLPTKSDCERAIEILKNETAKSEFDVTNVLNKLEIFLEENEKILHKDWRKITIGNLKTWFS